MAEIIHAFYESHRGAMEAAMRHRLDLAEAMLCERAHPSDIDGIRQEVMDEFEIVLTQMPYVGGAASRMSDFFMRLIGFMAISRCSGDTAFRCPRSAKSSEKPTRRNCSPCPKRNVSPRVVNSCRQRIRLCYASRLQKARQKAIRKSFRKISSTISSTRARVTTLNSASTTTLAAFANPRLAMEIKNSCRTFVGLISTPMQREASTWKGHKRWLSARTTAISDSRGSRRTSRRP